jgi:hypothetical protein
LSRSRSRTERLAPQKDHPQSQRRGNEWLESEIPAEERDNVKNREPERREEPPMPPPIVYVDTSAIREGKHQELEVAMKDLAAFVEGSMTRVISYGFFLNEDRTQMTVVAVHSDSESLEFHMDTGAAEFRKFADFIDLLRIEVYGAVSDGVRERLHQKARMLGSGTVAVHELYAGFTR